MVIATKTLRDKFISGYVTRRNVSCDLCCNGAKKLRDKLQDKQTVPLVVCMKNEVYVAMPKVFPRYICVVFFAVDLFPRQVRDEKHVLSTSTFSLVIFILFFLTLVGFRSPGSLLWCGYARKTRCTPVGDVLCGGVQQKWQNFLLLQAVWKNKGKLC